MKMLTIKPSGVFSLIVAVDDKPIMRTNNVKQIVDTVKRKFGIDIPHDSYTATNGVVCYSFRNFMPDGITIRLHEK